MLILLGVVIHGVKQFTAENADTKKGIEYIQSKENEERPSMVVCVLASASLRTERSVLFTVSSSS